ncbi:choice-of-anchor Y domain-containing protein [Calothrix sp. 336/3]|uniref:choice-of-anchor Y domain-containing protein n=1 Tax=Calothrix sp. 336/3 TaxID=1337936 RepID=UPI00069A84EB|nr:hypothetical protein [Calothrix sp. 336/3]
MKISLTAGWQAIATVFTLLATVNPAVALTLYNGLSTPSQTPSAQGWMYKATSILVVPTATTKGTILDSGDSSNYAGYFLQPTNVSLNRSIGYTVTFRLQVNSEAHSSGDRAGFNVILMSNLLTGETRPFGIELGFWEDSIWAQNVGFTRGERVSVDTKSQVKTYKLYVKDKNYQLFVNDKPILTGKLRQYDFTPPPGYPNPYATPRLIFMGDNTGSARAKVTIVNVEATQQVIGS